MRAGRLAGDRPAQPGPGHKKLKKFKRMAVAAWRGKLAERRNAHPERFERGRRGEQVLRGRVIAINPSPEGIAAMRGLGFRRLSDRTLPALGVRVIALRPPARMTAVAALSALQAADPAGAYELAHVYNPSEGEEAPPAGAPATVPAPGRDGTGLKLGMIDAGLRRDHPALRGAKITTQVFVEPPATDAASAHGTAVASLLVGVDERFQGAAPGAELFAADVFGDSIEGGSAEAIADALAWLAEQGVSVVNMSLEGPPNRLLDIVCQAAAARGVIIVAAVGNAGPTEPVAYPAAYPGVVAVTAVDAEGRVYLAAARGAEVDFAALGVDVEAAVDEDAYEVLSGTSFASPLIAAELAFRRRDGAAADALAALAAEAEDLGEPGRDAVYGFGRVR